MNNLLIQSTCQPEETLDYNEIAKHIQRKNLFQIAVSEGMKDDPEATISMIRSAYEDNPALVSKSIGKELLKQII